MKFIHSIARQLSLAEDRIKSLEKENSELRTELACITARSPSQPGRGVSSSLKRKHSTTPEHKIPSYAQSTTASRLRSSPSSCSSSRSTSPSIDQSSTPSTDPKLVSINKKRCFFKDGKLDVMEFGYLRPTIASRCRAEVSLLKKDCLRGASSTIDGTTEASSWGYSSDPWYDADEPKRKEELGEIKPANTLRIMSQTELDDLVTQKGIAKRTRLDDDHWTRRSAYRVYIDHDTLFDILSRAEALAKRCLWEWMHTHRPDECRLWLGYQSDVDFGRERLTAMLNGLPNNCFNHRYTRSWQVTFKLNRLIFLRNYLHHFNGQRQNLNRTDDDLKTVQELAVLLYDEGAAIQARALRDRLRDEALRTVGEIETFMMLKSLPEAGDLWKPHHMDLIRDAAYDLDSVFSTYYYPPIVYAAAREWESRQWSWDYVVSQPETKGQAQVNGISFWNRSSPDTTESVGTASSGQSNHTRLFRRHSVSAEAENRISTGGDKYRAGTRIRAASFCFSL